MSDDNWLVYLSPEHIFRGYRNRYKPVSSKSRKIKTWERRRWQNKKFLDGPWVAVNRREHAVIRVGE